MDPRPWSHPTPPLPSARRRRVGPMVASAGKSRRPWAPGRAVAALAAACPVRPMSAACCMPSPRSSAAAPKRAHPDIAVHVPGQHGGAHDRPDIPGHRPQTGVPSGLAASSAAARQHHRLGNTTPLSLAPLAAVSRRVSPHDCRLPAGITLCDGIGIGDSGHAPGARREGLDHWSSGGQGASAGRGSADPGRVPPHPAQDAPASGAGWAVFDKSRIAGSVRPSKHGANMWTKRTRKK